MLSRISNNLEHFFECGTMSDVVIISGKKQIRAHRAILAAQSPVFAGMFGNEIFEKQCGRVEIPNVEYEELHEIYCTSFTLVRYPMKNT